MLQAIDAPMLLEVYDLEMKFPVNRKLFSRSVEYIRALNGITFSLAQGETLGLVGESGSGKTTLGRCVLRALEPTDGKVIFHSEKMGVVDVMKLQSTQMRQMRPEMQMVFQDPYGSLDPKMTVFDLISEPLLVVGGMSKSQLRDRVVELMEIVGLDVRYLNRYPHAFSGGQRQRIGIARALATNPRLVVCDEAVSALDVSVKAQILNLLQDLQERFGIAYLFISHDLSVVQYIADRVAVLYLGQLMELGPSEDLFRAPLHPYTEALLAAIPNPDPEAARTQVPIGGETPDAGKPLAGCPFVARCPYVIDACQTTVPDWRELMPGRQVACHRAGELSLKGPIHEPAAQ